MYFLPSTWRRLGAHFLDQSYVVILQAPVLVMVIWRYIEFEKLRIHWAHILYLILVRFLYEALSLYFFSTTLGKRQMNLLVISRDISGDRSLRLDQIILRILVARLNIFFGWAVFALAFFTSNRTHLADWIADTQVVGTAPRASRPKIRWIVGSLVVFFIVQDSPRSAAMTLNALRWNSPYVEVDSKTLETLFEKIKFSIEFEDEDE